MIGVAYRGLFIIDPQQTIRQITINDLPVGRNVDEIVRLVEAFQFTDEVSVQRKSLNASCTPERFRTCPCARFLGVAISIVLVPLGTIVHIPLLNTVSSSFMTPPNSTARSAPLAGRRVSPPSSLMSTDPRSSLLPLLKCAELHPNRLGRRYQHTFCQHLCTQLHKLSAKQ